MQFNSFVFVAFLALFFSGWPLARRARLSRYLYLIGFNLLFYGWWDWRYCILLLTIGISTWLMGAAIHRWPRHGARWLAASVVLNLGLLGVYKYLGFFTLNLNALLKPLGASLPIIELALPIGISFYTFMALSYTLDIKRGRLEPTGSLLHFLAYLTLYPQLLAGPITRARDLLPQLQVGTPPTAAERWQGTRLIAHGLFKKMVIADNIAPVVNQAFGAAMLEQSAAYWWLIIALYTVQIYCDFSGYSDIAIGIGRWMGFRLAPNFDHPYIATGIRDFWNRWHISLTSFLRDYLFAPIANRMSRRLLPRGRKPARRELMLAANYGAYIATGVTFVLCGLWHGAAWTFVIWGALHALYLVVETATKHDRRLLKLPLGRIWAWALMMLQVAVAWVFFRAVSLEQAGSILAQMFDFSELDLAPALGISKFVLLVFLLAVAREAYLFFGLDKRLFTAGRYREWLEPVFLGVIIALSVFFRGPGNQFIYFKF